MAIHELFPYLCVANTAKAIEFYTKAFDAREKMRLTEPSGRIGHAEIEFGGTTLMVSDEFPECGITGPTEGCGTPVTLHLHVDNADAMITRALDLGATLERAPKDEFYGERSGVIRDPFGHRWNIGHQIEQVTPDEMQRRYTSLLQPGS
jgi:PhnB protein